MSRLVCLLDNLAPVLSHMAMLFMLNLNSTQSPVGNNFNHILFSKSLTRLMIDGRSCLMWSERGLCILVKVSFIFTSLVLQYRACHMMCILVASIFVLCCGLFFFFQLILLFLRVVVGSWPVEQKVTVPIYLHAHTHAHTHLSPTIYSTPKW